MTRGGWNRNIHYHDLVLAAVPAGCLRTLDVGCGAGRLAGELAEGCGEVIAIDVDPPALARARSRHARQHGCVAVAATCWMRLTNEVEPVMAPIRDSEETLSEIRASVEKILPGAAMRRELLFRYSLIWRKPSL